jgi:H+-transporting ATPase
VRIHNGAPALKKADCGIAVKGASDAAQSAADIVFLNDGLSTIILAIKTAREIFHCMRAYIVRSSFPLSLLLARRSPCLPLLPLFPFSHLRSRTSPISFLLYPLVQQIYCIALCLHLEIFPLLNMLIQNETICVDLIVFLAIFADVATIAIVYDNAQSVESLPEEVSFNF